MAARYWVGGTATWDNTAGTKWALTSGGAGGQTVPTSADDVFFDAASGVVTCTIGTTNGAKSINCTGFTGTLAGFTAITVAGSITFVAGMTVTYTGGWTFSASATITSAGKTISGAGGGVYVDGTGITVQLADALNVGTGRLSVNRGTFTTNDYNITAGDFVNNVSFVQTINLGASTVTLSSNFPMLLTANANLTLNAGTSTIVLSGATARLNNTGTIPLALANVNFTNTGTGTRPVIGLHTFNNLIVTAPASAGVTQVTFDSRQTINGTLSTTGTAGNRRVWFRGATYGIAQTLTVNSTPSLTDTDFRDIYVIGTAAPISGTRIGDLRGCIGITFSTPKTVYRIGVGDWTDNQWSATSGGGVSTDNFPLAQDTAVIDQLSTSPLTLNTVITYAGSVDFSARTSAFTFSALNAWTFYGNLKLGSGVTLSGTASLTLSGRNTQIITSAGKAFSGGITVDTYGGSVELADALNIGSNTLTVTNGTFDTKNYAVTAGSLVSNNTNVRTITLGSSTLTASSTSTSILLLNTNLTFNAGTSSIFCTGTTSIGVATLSGGGVTFYNVFFTNTTAGNGILISGTNTFNNLSITAPSTTGLNLVAFSVNQTITGTFTVAGAAPTRRIFVRSGTLGTPRTLTVNTLAATDCDFRDVVITGAAVNSVLTRAGDCGGNSGIVFPTAKTLYWTLAGAQNWSATAWAPSSGGTPDINNFPLAQDTAVFDNAGAAGTVTINAAWNIGTFDASARTSAMTLTNSTNAAVIYGDWKFGTGVTSSTTATAITFSKQGTQTITSNGVVFGCPVTINRATAIVQLADAIALTSTVRLTFDAGTFDAVNYNVTSGYINCQSSFAIIKMGTGTWTASADGTNGNLWDFTPTPTLYKGSANIVLSNTGTTARTFAGGNFSYNKLTIGGTTGISALTITGNNQFTELASTKTVAHTINFGSTTQTFGKWTVSGSLGNVVTVNGSGTSHVIAGARVSGIDYVNMYIGFSIASPGEFYAGANSVGTGTRVINTAAPAPTTRYWVGSTGNWDNATTTRWSATSGGSGGASVPTSADDVIFDAASSAGSYTVTIVATTGARCNSLTFAAPASGTVTWAGTTALYIHGNVTLPATGLIRTYTGAITLSGSTAGKTLTTNGVVLGSSIRTNGVGCEWSLGSALNIGASNSIFPENGLFAFNVYNVTAAGIELGANGTKTLDLGSSTLTFSGSTPLSFGTTATASDVLTFNAGTSQINCTTGTSSFSGNGKTFYNVSFTNTGAGTVTLNGTNTFNNLSFTGNTATGLRNISVTANQIINGTLTLSAGTNATMRHFVRSDVLETPRTLTCNSVVATDVDFRDIVIAGAAAPVSGTRLGDCKGNSGITFDTPKIVYWNLTSNDNWSATAWATSNGGTPAANNFPLAQDTAVFTSTRPSLAATITVNAAYNIGTIDMSARTTNVMTLATGSNAPTIYGNWINGTGTTLTGSGNITFAGRNTQTITSAGKTFTQPLYFNNLSGSVTLQDSITLQTGGISLSLVSGTFNTNNFSVTGTSGGSGFDAQGSITRILNMGSTTWTFVGSGTVWNITTSTNLSVTGTGTINLTSAAAKTFAGGNVSYAGITLNQGNAGTLTITGNNTFADITNTYAATGATTIALGTTTQRVGKFSASGAAGKVLTVTGTSASSPATLIYTGAGEATAATTDYLNVIGVRAYNLNNTWKAGANSTNSGSLGWIFAAGTVVAVAASTFFLMF